MGEMTEADRMAFEHWWHYECGDGEAIDITGQAWQAALDHARGKQEPACFIQKEALSELRKYKDATTTVSSGRIRNPFGNPAPLYTAPPARNEKLARLRAIEAAALAWWEGRTPRDSREIALCAALAASPAPETVINAVCVPSAISKPKVKALDLSNLLKHAFISGAIAKDASKWVDYIPPEGSATFRRILSAIEGGEDDRA